MKKNWVVFTFHVVIIMLLIIIGYNLSKINDYFQYNLNKRYVNDYVNTTNKELSGDTFPVNLILEIKYIDNLNKYPNKEEILPETKTTSKKSYCKIILFFSKNDKGKKIIKNGYRIQIKYNKKVAVLKEKIIQEFNHKKDFLLFDTIPLSDKKISTIICKNTTRIFYWIGKQYKYNNYLIFNPIKNISPDYLYYRSNTAKRYQLQILGKNYKKRSVNENLKILYNKFMSIRSKIIKFKENYKKIHNNPKHFDPNNVKDYFSYIKEIHNKIYKYHIDHIKARLIYHMIRIMQKSQNRAYRKDFRLLLEDLSLDGTEEKSISNYGYLRLDSFFDGKFTFEKELILSNLLYYSGYIKGDLFKKLFLLISELRKLVAEKTKSNNKKIQTKFYKLLKSYHFAYYPVQMLWLQDSNLYLCEKRYGEISWRNKVLKNRLKIFYGVCIFYLLYTLIFLGRNIYVLIRKKAYNSHKSRLRQEQQQKKLEKEKEHQIQEQANYEERKQKLLEEWHNLEIKEIIDPSKISQSNIIDFETKLSEYKIRELNKKIQKEEYKKELQDLRKNIENIKDTNIKEVLHKKYLELEKEIDQITRLTLLRNKFKDLKKEIEDILKRQ